MRNLSLFFGLVFVLPVVASLPAMALLVLGGANTFITVLAGIAVACILASISMSIWSRLRRQPH